MRDAKAGVLFVLDETPSQRDYCSAHHGARGLQLDLMINQTYGARATASLECCGRPRFHLAESPTGKSRFRKG